ncbi:MAG: holo-ACP synthase [Verrucomicrobiales bacterium]
MTIFGIGIDIIEIRRVQDALAKGGARLLEKTFTAGEIAYCGPMRFAPRHFAARFAAKEAVAKAFGTGIGEHANWTDIEVVRLDSGAPAIVLGGAAAAFATRRGITEVKISLTHSDDYAAAYAVALGAGAASGESGPAGKS